MMIGENIKIGLASIRKSRFRSFFTMLGIIIGVVSVVTIVSLGEGVKRQIIGQSSDLGSNLVTVRPGKLVSRDETGKISSVNLFASTGIASLTAEDAESIRRVPNVRAVVSFGAVSGLPSYDGRVFNDGFVIATSKDLTSVIDHRVEFGTFFSDEMMTKKNAVIGSGVAEKLFKETIPIGKSVTIRGQQFTVQGVFEPFTEVPIASGVDLNNTIFIPEPVSRELMGASAPIYEILVKAVSPESINAITADIGMKVKDNHAGQEDFTVFKQDEVSAASEELLDLLTRMIIGMAGITLFVGGVGIMNVMLVSVSERKREISIRKAIGATNRQIWSQFMVETTILSIWGAILGVIISGLLNLMIRIFTDLEPVLMWEPVLIASVVSVLVGILFGVIPAVKASQKDPIDSLRPNS